MKRVIGMGLLLAALSAVAGVEIKVLKPGSSFNPADYDVGEIRDFVKGGGYLVGTDMLYAPVWDFLGKIDPDFGAVKWRTCGSWWGENDSQTRPPKGKKPHPLVSEPNAYDDADTWGHFIGSSCKGWTVLAECGDGEPMLLYRPLGKGGVIAAANLWWYGEVPQILLENIDAWAKRSAKTAKRGVKAEPTGLVPGERAKRKVGTKKTGFGAEANGVFRWNGQPFFPLGLYHVDPDDYEEVMSLGFNFVQTFKYKMIMQKGIAKAEKLKLPVLVEGDYHDIPKHALDMFKKSPSTAMWYVSDEPKERTEAMKEASKAYWEWDKDRLTFITSNRPDLFGWIATFADVFSCDCYGDMGKCVDWLRRVDRTVPAETPFIFVPPARPKDSRFLRAQAFLGIAHGANGLIWYAWKDEGHPKEALYACEEEKSAFRELLAELAANAEWLTSPTRVKFETGSAHGIVLGDPSGVRKAFLVNVLAKKGAKVSYKLPDGALVTRELEPLEAAIVEIPSKKGRRK